ncbi:MAG: carboxymuconolactone decarboxylase family protein [Proteobacteria bacterium]|nr:carboxymuconolactone decarboxylase family protein [Pseudomonadota bacterium]
MHAVSYLEPEQASPLANEMYTKATERFEMLLNIFKVMGHAPELMSPFSDFIMEILQDGKVDWVTKELLILKSTRLNECRYCVVQHETLSGRLGISNEKIADLSGDRYKTSPHFSDAEKAILELTDQIWKDANRVSDELWGRVRQHYDEGQIVEIVATITTYIMISKFGDALGVELEDVFSGVEPILFRETEPAE